MSSDFVEAIACTAIMVPVPKKHVTMHAVKYAVFIYNVVMPAGIRIRDDSGTYSGKVI